MLEILHGITSNEDTVNYLNSKSQPSDNVPTDLSSLKEKLLQQVGSKAFSGLYQCFNLEWSYEFLRLRQHSIF